MTLQATLYTKPGCHLCETAMADLRRLRRRHPHRLEQVDITTDPALFRRYAELIPVLEIAGRQYAAPLDAVLLERALSEAAAAEAHPTRPPPPS
jgi:glutaredoxin-like protein DUF836